MSGRLIAALTAILALCGAAAAGYLLGASQSEANAAEEPGGSRAPALAYLAAYGSALDDKRGEGIRAGLAKRERASRRAGSEAGSTAAAETIADARKAGGEADANERVVSASVTRRSEVAGGAGVDQLIDRNFSGAGDVLVVGDSLEVLTSPYLQQYLPKVDLTINAVGGYSSIQIFGLFEESYDPSQSVIVFDAGTNDNPNYPEILAGNLEKVADIVGDRCMVVPTIHGLPVDGVDSTGKNRVVAAFARSRPNTVVPDWAGAEASHPELMQPDDLHPTAEGADFRAQLIADGVRTCLDGTSSLAFP